MMWYEKIATALSWVSTAILSGVLQNAKDILAIICLVISFICSILNTVIPLIVKAKKDGKITPDEVEEIIDAIKDSVDKEK